MSLPMDQGARLWLLKTVRQHYWRVCSYMELDDLIQDGYLHWARCAGKYWYLTARPERRHFMRLFQRTFLNHLHNLSKARTRDVELAANYPAPDTTHSPSDTALLVIATAPAPVRSFLHKVASKPTLLRHPNRVYRDGTRQTFNEKLCAIAEIEPSVDLRRLLQEQLP